MERACFDYLRKKRRCRKKNLQPLYDIAEGADTAHDFQAFDEVETRISIAKFAEGGLTESETNVLTGLIDELTPTEIAKKHSYAVSYVSQIRKRLRNRWMQQTSETIAHEKY